MSSARTFLVEAYAPASSELSSLAAEARDVALASDGHQVKHIRSILVPEDETCFHLYEADTAESVAIAINTTEMRAQRIVEVRA